MPEEPEKTPAADKEKPKEKEPEKEKAKPKKKERKKKEMKVPETQNQGLTDLQRQLLMVDDDRHMVMT